MVIYIDIDETICDCPKNRNFSKAIPIKKNIEKINQLYLQGHQIVYWTARGSICRENNFFHLTLQQLFSWDCLFHELRMGKPFYDILIDDRAFRIEEINDDIKDIQNLLNSKFLEDEK